MPLKVSDGASAWIKDFKKSDAPQFKGKSDKERRDMALAAYLSAKNEDVKSADKKPETYIKPDGKTGVRMVPVDKAVVKSEGVKEETSFEVNIEGLPMMFMSGMGPGQIKAKLRKIVKQPSMIQSVKRVTDADVKKTFRLKAQGRDEDEDQVDESSYGKLNKYYKDANTSIDRATNSAVATIFRRGDHSKDLNTMRKRERGIKLAKSRITDKIRKGQK